VTGIRQIRIKQVPEAVTAVTVGVAPLHEAMAIDGSYSGTGGSYTATLTEEADGKTWSMAGGDDGPFFLPSAGKPTITVNFTSAEGTTSYSYSAAEELVANRKLSIEGTYTEQAKLKVTGSITGNDWDDDQTISFEFDETSSSGTSSGGSSETGGSESGGSESGSGSETTQTETMPEVGDLYKGKYYVLSVDEPNHKILVFSPTERAMGIAPSQVSEADAKQALNTALSTWEDNPIGEWRIPSYDEMSLIISQRTSVTGKYNNFGTVGKQMYFFTVKEELAGCGQNGMNISGYTKTTTETLLRPVATVTVPVSN
jgi:hypothetical protein